MTHGGGSHDQSMEVLSPNYYTYTSTISLRILSCLGTYYTLTIIIYLVRAQSIITCVAGLSRNPIQTALSWPLAFYLGLASQLVDFCLRLSLYPELCALARVSQRGQASRASEHCQAFCLTEYQGPAGATSRPIQDYWWTIGAYYSRADWYWRTTRI